MRNRIDPDFHKSVKNTRDPPLPIPYPGYSMMEMLKREKRNQGHRGWK